MVALNFDASAVQESTGGYELIEPGKYRAEIVADEVKESKSTPGNHYLELQVKVDGTGSIWDRLNLWNSNPSAVEIANGTLKQIANAIGQSRIADSAEMLLKPLMVRVEIEPGTAGYKGSGARPQQVAQAAQAPVPPSAPFPTAASAPTANAPWRS